jgi:hypothetical protein
MLLYLPFMALIAYFSTNPRFTHLPPDKALLRLSLSHAGERIAECKQRSAEELAKLPPNMRAALDCPRERSPVKIELELDGVQLLSAEIAPSGMRRDGASSVYQRLIITAGEHHIAVRLKDRPGNEFNFHKAQSIKLAPGGALLIDFNAAQGGFIFRG